jgi:hypothetical protein
VLLEDGLGVVDDVEAAHAGVVGRRVLLGLVARGGVDEDGGVASPDEAVVEVHPDQPRAHAGLTGVAAADGVAHDLLRLRARVLVEPHLQILPRVWHRPSVRHRGGHDDERRACQRHRPRRPHRLRYDQQLITSWLIK